ncbi:uncharacterized protein LOC108861873 isoform X1 [Raphanus sativus]|uniref:Uncharacterized protein LOC108861873 isoform X1 n=2 Tax=Raphanus sativus TaxID=3726 RepID=A0A6J0P3J2_RAPSA|nr:uncharacterized protein LOC108861873 isoform X1 [Raphanus sativus]
MLGWSMSNGVGEGGRRSQSREKRKLFQGSDFSYALARTAVAQICESVEFNNNMYQESRQGVRFTSFQESALDTLAGVALHYIHSIGKTAQFYANVAGRVEGNSLDIVQALADLGSASGVSDTGSCLADSMLVRDIIRYTGEAEKMPFVYALPRFPITKEKRHAPPSFSEVRAEPPDVHIPVWLPSFPETNVDTIQGGAVSKENGGRSEVFKSSKDVRNSPQGEEEMEGNPFLTAPLRFLENRVSNELVDINHFPDKHSSNNHHIPVLEASALSDDINWKNRFSESEDGEKKGGARPQQTLLRFKIGTLKRPSCLATKRSVQGRRWFKEGEVKREKKSDIEENHQRIDSDVK